MLEITPSPSMTMPGFATRNINVNVDFGPSSARYLFSAETDDADPGDGNLRLNTAQQNLASVIRVDELDLSGVSMADVLDSFDNSNSDVKGHIRLYKLGDLTKWLEFQVNSITAPSGYRNINVVKVAQSETNPFVAGDTVVLTFSRTGDQGTADVDVNYLPSFMGSVARPIRSRLEERISVLDFGAVGDGTTDDTPAIQAAVDFANGRDVFLPGERQYRITETIVREVTLDTFFRPSMRLIGDGWTNNANDIGDGGTAIIADFDNAPAIEFRMVDDTDFALRTIFNSKVENLQIGQAPGRVGVEGIRLAAAWFVDLRTLRIAGMSSHGINVPIMPGVHAISDNYQCLYLQAKHLEIKQCVGWGVRYAAGQSPGLWSIKNSTIANCNRGGLFSSTGHFDLSDNLFVGNGNATFGDGNVTLDFAPDANPDEKGPMRVWRIISNELDPGPSGVTNLRFRQCTSGYVKQNRIAASASGNLFELGDVVNGGANVRNCIIEQNEIRTGATGISAYPVIAFLPSAESDSGGVRRVSGNIIRNNYFPPHQQTSGLVKFHPNFNILDGNQIIEDSQLIKSSGVGRLVIAKRTLGGTLGTSNTNIRFNSEDCDFGDNYNSTTGDYVSAVQGFLRFTITLTLEGTGAGQEVTLFIQSGASGTVRVIKEVVPAAAEHSIRWETMVPAARGEAFTVQGRITTPARNINIEAAKNVLTIEAAQ